MIVARGEGPHLRDPNWYRVRYALAVQCIQIATMSNKDLAPRKEPRFRIRRGGSEVPDEAGWPANVHVEEGDWRKEFGEVTADTLSELYGNRTPAREHFDQAGRVAREAAEELVSSAAEMLQEEGWYWVRRKPPRFVRWKRALSPGRITGRQPVLDSELVRFLSWVVEPAAVVLLFSAWLAEDEEGFPLAQLQDAIGGPRAPGFFAPLDRRKREAGGVDWLIAYVARLLYDERQSTRGIRAQASLGRTQLRSPRESSFRVQYNLACLFSRLASMAARGNNREGAGQFLSIAAVQLEKALFRLPDEQRDRLASWAAEDPGLATLRRQRSGEFAEIVTRWGVGDKQESKLDDPILIQRLKYDPGSEILDVYLLDGGKKQYVGVPPNVIDALLAPLPGADAGTRRKERRTRERAFLKAVERDYPSLRP